MTARRDRAGLGALLLYGAIAFLAFGIGALTQPGSRYVGTGADPESFIWLFAWWPHAILHWTNPFVTHAVWSPSGVNLAWTALLPGLALLFAPLTLAAGPVLSYSIAAVLMPAFTAWAAFLLCRHLTRQLWPSLVGGYLFGFSSYVLGQELGHMQLTSAFVIPLAALVVLQYVEDELSAWALVVRLGPLLALQVLISTEVAFTLTLALACSLAVAFAVAPASRPRLVTSIVPLLGAYAFAAVLTAPFDYYLLTGISGQAIHPAALYNADLLNFIVPTRLTLVGRGWADSIAQHFPANISEQGAYLGVPALVIVALFAWRRWRTPGARFLVVSFLLAVLATLGFELVVYGHNVVALPWEHVGYRPLFRNVLPVRLSLFVSLAVAVMVSSWAASQEGAVRWVLPALAIVATLPYPGLGTWSRPYAVPPFFTDAAYRRCLAPGETILPLPVNAAGDADLWQAVSDFRFAMAGGYLTEGPPAGFVTSKAVKWIAFGNPVRAAQAQLLRDYIRDKHVAAVVVDPSQSRNWAAALDRIATRRAVGGVLLYRIAGPASGCPER